MIELLNRKRKGSKTRYFIKKEFENHGFKCAVVPETRFSQDLFGVADIVAIKNGQIYLIQAKSNFPGNIKKYQSFSDISQIPVYIVVKKDRNKDLDIIVTSPCKGWSKTLLKTFFEFNDTQNLLTGF